MFDINFPSQATNKVFGNKLKTVVGYMIVFILYSCSTWAAAGQPVIVLNTTGQPPLSTNSSSGFMDEVARAAFQSIGYQLQLVRLPAERGLKSSNQGAIDGELVRVKGMEKLYPNLIRVPEKIMDWEFVVFSYDSINLKKGWQALSGKSVAHINGWKILEKNIPSSAEVTKVSNALSLFKLLRRNHTDYVLYERWGGLHLLIEQVMGDVKLRQPPLAVKEMFIYLHKKHQALVPKLAAELLVMKQDGRYQRLINKHLQQFR